MYSNTYDELLLCLSSSESDIDISDDSDHNDTDDELPVVPVECKLEPRDCHPSLLNSSFAGTYDSDSKSDCGDFPTAHDWCKADPSLPPPPRFPFVGTPGITVTVPNAKDPLSYFELFFSEDVIQMIVRETNLCAKRFMEKSTLKVFSRTKFWFDTNDDEIRVFISLLILQGVLHKPKESWYWSRKPIIETPFIGRVMTEKRFRLLMKFLHFSNTTPTGHPAPKLRKVWDLFQILVKKFSTVYMPERDICIGESLILFKGRLSMKQDNDNGSNKIKSFILYEAESGYIWNAIFCTGRDTRFLPEYENYGIATKSVLSLCDKLLRKGHCLTVDNYYTSPELAEILISKETDVYGAIQLNRKNVPPALRLEKLTKGQIMGYRKGKILVFKWIDKKPVSLLSTIHNIEITEKQVGGRKTRKPRAVFDYSDAMGGLDKLDQCCCTSTKKQQKKYYKKIFRYLLDQSVWNSYVLYKKGGGDMDQLEFRLNLAEVMIGKYKGSTPPSTFTRSSAADPLRFIERHFPSHLPANAVKKEPTRRCVVCCNTLNEHGKKVRKETRYYCRNCNAALCPAPCFEIYHTKPE